MRSARSVEVSLCAVAVAVLGCSGVARAQQPPPVQTTPPQASTPTAGPVPLGVNGQLASWLQVRGEYRARIEGFNGGGFTPGNEDAYWEGRLRLNATVRPSTSLRFFVQAQDARAYDKVTGGLTTPLRDTFDLRLAYG
jgi:hypothetical protein